MPLFVKISDHINLHGTSYSFTPPCIRRKSNKVSAIQHYRAVLVIITISRLPE